MAPGSYYKPADISIHALCEEGDPNDPIMCQSYAISIHALCEEGDVAITSPLISQFNFYPRPLRGGRLQCLVTWSSHRYFYPRPLRGGRPLSPVWFLTLT